jgi:hypothetical protein
MSSGWDAEDPKARSQIEGLKSGTPNPVLREVMQNEQYGIPKEPELSDAKRLFEWVLGGEVEDDKLIQLPCGPRVRIIGQAPGH